MIDRRRMLTAAVGAFAAAGAARAAGRSAVRPRDLEGVWSTASFTDLERPAAFPALALTPAQAEAYEAPRRKLHGVLPHEDGIGQAENEWTDRGTGLARVKGQIRSSWIIDPPDGRIPFRPEFLAQPRSGFAGMPARLDNPEDFNGTSRCIATFAAGAPMVVGPDSNLFQIVQTRDEVAIHSEKYHDVRIVRLCPAGDPPPPPLPPSWLGDSVGRWRGETLVIETCGFRPGLVDRNMRLYQTEAGRVVERFTRIGPEALFYEFTVTDPSLYTQPWRAEMTLAAAKARIFEYACHEGNYSLPGMLAGARVQERARAAP